MGDDSDAALHCDDCSCPKEEVYKHATIALSAILGLIVIGVIVAVCCLRINADSGDPYSNRNRKQSALTITKPPAAQQRRKSSNKKVTSAISPTNEDGTSRRSTVQQQIATQKISDGAPVLVDGELKSFGPDIEAKMEMGADVMAFKPARMPSFLNFWNHAKEKHTYDWEITFSEIKFDHQLASGNFGTVHQAIWMGTEVAVKLPLENLPQHQMGFFLREVQLMASLHHPNIVTFMGACITEPNVCLVMEFLSMGCVYDFVRIKDPEELKKVHYHHGHWINIVIKFGLDIARGMQYLHHRCKIIQRDLKSRNLLLDTFHNVKVCDFGLSRIHDTQDPKNGNKSGRRVSVNDNTMTACGTPFWTAPEVIRNERYNHKADVFSYSIVLYELLARRDPYTDDREHGHLPVMEIAYHVAESNLRPTIPKDCPKIFSTLMKDCWADKPNERPDFSEVLERLVVVKKALAEGKGDDDLGSYLAHQYLGVGTVHSPHGTPTATSTMPPPDEEEKMHERGSVIFGGAKTLVEQVEREVVEAPQEVVEMPLMIRLAPGASQMNLVGGSQPALGVPTAAAPGNVEF